MGNRACALRRHDDLVKYVERRSDSDRRPVYPAPAWQQRAALGPGAADRGGTGPGADEPTAGQAQALQSARHKPPQPGRHGPPWARTGAAPGRHGATAGKAGKLAQLSTVTRGDRPDKSPVTSKNLYVILAS